MTLSSSNRLPRRSLLATILCLVTLAITGTVAVQQASAADDVMPAAAAGSRYTGWAYDVEATCLFSRSFFVTTGSQIDVYLPDQLKTLSFYARPWMKIVNASGSRWVTTGWQHLNPSNDNGYPIKFSWSVTGRDTYFYPAVELYFPNGARTFSLAVTHLAGMFSNASPQGCYLGG